MDKNKRDPLIQSLRPQLASAEKLRPFALDFHGVFIFVLTYGKEAGRHCLMRENCHGRRQGSRVIPAPVLRLRNRSMKEDGNADKVSPIDERNSLGDGRSVTITCLIAALVNNGNSFIRALSSGKGIRVSTRDVKFTDFVST